MGTTTLTTEQYFTGDHDVLFLLVKAKNYRYSLIVQNSTMNSMNLYKDIKSQEISFLKNEVYASKDINSFKRNLFFQA